MIVGCLCTRDGRWRVYLHDDHTAELVDRHGHPVTGRVPMYQVGQRLAALGIAVDDLVPD
jgi:hypothetical protein